MSTALARHHTVAELLNSNDKSLKLGILASATYIPVIIYRPLLGCERHIRSFHGVVMSAYIIITRKMISSGGASLRS